ncbi:MAG TPA: hypothetical protein VK742_00390 [Candidatus Sulfotelmatobacter sp.]|nr:hypothetical protein [Candidatus Sulfotelmatobacter sp.]
MRLFVIVILCALLAAGGVYWLRGPTHPPMVNAGLYENDMVAGLVRRLLTKLAPPLPSVCFLAFGDGTTPPDPRFIARFAGCNPPVRSCGSAAMPPINQFFDTRTGRRGLVIHIVRFKEIKPGIFEVQVSFSNLTPGHDQFIYHVTELSGDWVVMSCTAA